MKCKDNYMELCFKCGLWSLVIGALLYLGIKSWVNQKGYIFSAEEVAEITNHALRVTQMRGYIKLAS